MDSQINAAALALATGDVLGALKRVALRDDPPALALRGIVMAQLGDFERAKALLKDAARRFGKREIVARARCILAEAEIALVSRDLAWPSARLEEARDALLTHGDLLNAAHARTIEARRLLLLGHLEQAECALAVLDPTRLPPALRASYHLVTAGIAIRRVRAANARQALASASEAATLSGITPLVAEVDAALQSLDQPAALLVKHGETQNLSLDQVEGLLASDALVIDATRSSLRQHQDIVALSTRPVLFALMRILAEAWPQDVSREHLLQRAFNARHADESHRARLRVEIARLRQAIASLAEISATPGGFIMAPKDADAIAILASPLDDYNAAVMALLADGELWSSSALALVLDTSARSVQRALAELESRHKAQPVGRGRARRWTLSTIPGFPTTLLLPQSN